MCVLEWACWCRSRVPLHGGAQGAAVSEWCLGLGTGLLVPLKGAVAGCGCRVILSKGCCRVLLSECGVGYEAWVLVWLRDVYGSVGVGP